jgi:hypothetical protein
VGCLLCRSPLSVGLAAQPPPVAPFGETATPTLEASCLKRARREETGGDSGRIEDDCRSLQLESVVGETRTEDPAHLEVPVGAVSCPTAIPEAGSMPAEETAPAGADLSPPPTAKNVTAGIDAAIHVSSNLPSQESVRETAAGETKKAPEPALQAPSNLELVPSVQAVVPAAGIRASVTIDSLLLGLVSSSGEASQGLLTTRVARNECGDDSPAPEAVTKGASSRKALVTVAGSGIGSLSSASQL